MGRPSKGLRIRVGVRFPATLHTLITREAAEQGVTVNDYVVRAVRTDLSRSAAMKPPPPLRRSAL